MTHTIRIELEEVADGDVIDLAQRIWEDNSEDFDSKLGHFTVSAQNERVYIWENGSETE